MTNVNGSRKPENPYEMEKSQTPTTVRSYGVAQYDYEVLLQFLFFKLTKILWLYIKNTSFIN